MYRLDSLFITHRAVSESFKRWQKKSCPCGSVSSFCTAKITDHTRDLTTTLHAIFHTPPRIKQWKALFPLFHSAIRARHRRISFRARGGDSFRLQYYCDRVLRSSAFGDILRLTEPTRCGRVCFCSSWVAFVRSFPCQAFWVFSLFALLRNLARSSLLLSFCYDGGNSDFPVAATGAAATRQTRVAFWFTMVLQLWQSTTGCKLVVLVVSLE